MTDPQLPPPGWYPEPSGAEGQRWWDGTRWTDYATPLAPPPQPVQPQYGAYAQPQPQYGAYVQPPQPQYGAYASPQQPAPYGSASQTVAAGTPTDTVWIWLIIFLPLLGVVPLVLIDWHRVMELSMAAQNSLDPAAQLAVYSDPWYIVSSLSGWVILALVVLFAYLDRRELLRRGFAQPFHWAWAFFAFVSILVYVIGRSVVVKRRSGRGMAPMWVAIALNIALIVAGIIWGVSLVAEIISMAVEMTPGY